MTRTASNNLTRSSLFRGILIMMTLPTAMYFIAAIRGNREDHIFHSIVIVPFLVWQISYHAYLISKYFENFTKAAVISGILSGLIFTFAGRIGVIIAYLLLSKGRQLNTAGIFFIDYWYMYFGAAIFGGICMLVKPISMIIFKKK